MEEITIPLPLFIVLVLLSLTWFVSFLWLALQIGRVLGRMERKGKDD